MYLLILNVLFSLKVMLINAVKDVTSALGDLMQATKSASGKNMQHPAMHTLKDAAKVGLAVMLFTAMCRNKTKYFRLRRV